MTLVHRQNEDDEHPITLRRVLQSTDYPFLAEAVCDGLRIGLLPAYISQAPANRALLRVLPQYRVTGPQNLLYIITLHNRYPLPATQALIDYLRAEIVTLAQSIVDFGRFRGVAATVRSTLSVSCLFDAESCLSVFVSLIDRHGSGYAFCISRPPPTIAALGRRALAGHEASFASRVGATFGSRLRPSYRPLRTDDARRVVGLDRRLDSHHRNDRLSGSVDAPAVEPHTIGTMEFIETASLTVSHGAV